MLGGNGTASGFSHELRTATKALQFPTIFVNHATAAKAMIVDLSLDSGKRSHTNSNSNSY